MISTTLLSILFGSYVVADGNYVFRAMYPLFDNANKGGETGGGESGGNNNEETGGDKGDKEENEEEVIVEPPRNITISNDRQRTRGDSKSGYIVVVRNSKGVKIGSTAVNRDGSFDVVDLAPIAERNERLEYIAINKDDIKSEKVYATAGDYCTIKSKSKASLGECAWFNTEGRFLGMLYNKGLIQGGSPTYGGGYQLRDFAQSTPSGPFNYYDSKSRCDNNEVTNDQYSLMSTSELQTLSSVMKNNDITVFSTNNGWAWSSNREIVNMHTGQVKTADLSQKFDRYCKVTYKKLMPTKNPNPGGCPVPGLC